MMDNEQTTARLLLADDHEIVRSGIRNALADLEGVEIVGEVGDGIALDLVLQATKPDCLLIDVTMPDFEPITAIEQICLRYPTMKILVVSAYDDDIYVQGLLRAGVDGYHLKEQSLSDLRLAVQRVLAGEKWVSSRLVSKLVGLQTTSTVDTDPQTANDASEQPSLTNRQQEILHLLQEGLDNQAIARRMALSVKTIENHLTRLYRQLDVQSRLEAVRYASQHPEIFDDASLIDETLSLKTNDKGNTIHILLVDDNGRYRRQLRRMVTKVAQQVASRAIIHDAPDISSAVEIAQQVQPHLALVDVVLGDEDGIRCTRQLKANIPMVRVVLITAYPDREFHRLGLEAGAVALIDKKDLDADVLRQVIADVC